MPELGMRGPMKQELNASSKFEGTHFSSTWEEIANKYNREKLGFGAECFVIDTEDKNKVFAIKYKGKEPAQAKIDYYSSKILTTLFPYNFPKVYASFAKGEDNTDRIPGTVRERIYGTRADKDNVVKKSMRFLRNIGIIPVLFSYNREKDSNHSFSEVQKRMKELYHNFAFDDSDCNFITDKKGNEYYIDTPINLFSSASDKNYLLNYMKKNNYTENEIATVTNAIDRVLVLKEEKEKNLESADMEQ